MSLSLHGTCEFHHFTHEHLADTTDSHDNVLVYRLRQYMVDKLYDASADVV